MEKGAARVIDIEGQAMVTDAAHAARCRTHAASGRECVTSGGRRLRAAAHARRTATARRR
ncbi:Hypothetical protein CAP_5677 [Chondromyces apiculatus DSM 436]|uniref:Uncharacterized protein n=1 Tax=Chondromyces apiculatus DSM 436 TaxID=1192034 RepID=A0A017T3B8_9BACT|nr:Hypothetical protein CAP_5677 [Chondromyces apiculatus DSM 436]